MINTFTAAVLSLLTAAGMIVSPLKGKIKDPTPPPDTAQTEEQVPEKPAEPPVTETPEASEPETPAPETPEVTPAPETPAPETPEVTPAPETPEVTPAPETPVIPAPGEEDPLYSSESDTQTPPETPAESGETDPIYTSEFDLTQFDCKKQGYGMGHEVDSENVPKGAEDFNGAYSEFDAYALNNTDGIILTFDNGYENGLTAGILDTLKDKGVKAIFFVTGDYVSDNKKLVQRMIDEGHIIGNHGMDHESLPDLSYAEICDELMSLHNLVKDEFGYEMSYMRPPKGEFSEASLAAAQNLGYTTLLWSFAYVDWEQSNQPSEEFAFDKICDCVHPGEIALLHAVSSANAEVLPEVIDYVRSLGLDFEIPETTPAELTIFVKPDSAHRIYSVSPFCACA